VKASTPLAPHQALLTATAKRMSAGSPTRELVRVALVAASCCVLLSLALGRDINWDYYNYHGYAALSVLQDRLGQDFWPAGVQGYLNPLPFLPFAWMQQAGWPSAVVASVLAVIQSLSLLALYGISRHLARDHSQPWLSATLMTALGAASCVFASQIGSTFVDATTTPLLMAAIWLLVAGTSNRSVFLAAGLSGAAMALKWTHAPFAVGLLLAASVRLLQTHADGPVRARGAALLSLSLLAGFLLCYGWWGWRLHQEFGSPLFPLFNGIFQSPDATAESASYQRYVPQTWTQLFSLPLRMIEHEPWVYTEIMAPDIRPLLLVLLGPLGWAWARYRNGRLTHSPNSASRLQALPLPLVVFVLVSTALWLVTSTNGRYAVPLLLLLGPMLYVVIGRLIGERRALLVCTLLVLGQVGHSAATGNPRWSPGQWSDAWLPLAPLPESLTRQPQLFVVVGRQSESYLAALVHPGSVFVNPIGLVSLRNDGPGWSRFTSRRDAFVGRTQVVFLLNPEDTRAEMVLKAEGRNRFIDRLALKMDVERCQRLVLNAQNDPYTLPKNTRLGNVQGRHLASCPAVAAKPDAALAHNRALATEVMDAFEARCPAMLSPRQTQIEGNGISWERYYGKFDLFLSVNLANGQIQLRQERQVDKVLVGRVPMWRSDVERFTCRLPHGGERGISTMASGQ